MKLLATGLVLVLAGCAAKSPESRIGEHGQETPGRWAARKEARAGIDTNWVSRIGGRQASLFVGEAFQANPNVRIAAERVNRAIASAKTAGASMNPQISAGLNANRSKQVFVGFPFGGGGVPSSQFNSFGSAFSVSWEPDIWGFARAGQASLVSLAQAEGQNYRAVRASLAAQVLRAWLAVTEANAQIALAKEAQELRETTLEIVRDRFSSALSEQGGSASQFRLAESELASSKAVVAQREGERAQAVRQLELLMGRYPKGALANAQKLPKVPAMPPAGLPSELLLRRPDILEAERKFASTGKLLKQGELAFYPSFSLTAQTGSSTDSFKNLLKSDFGVWSLAGNLTQPIWAGGALRSEYSRLKSDERSALASFQGTVLRAFGEVEQALAAERYLVRREEALMNASQSAIAAADAAKADYSGGTGDALTLITAQSNRINLASQLVTLHRLRLDNRVTLHLALGGDYRIGN